MRRYALLPFALIAAVSAAPAQSETADTVMEVSAIVTESCTVSATPMTFALSNRSQDATARSSVDLNCTPAASFEVAIDRGGHANGETRRMFDPVSGDYLPYEIYQDAGLSHRWGSRSGMDTVGGNAGQDGQLTLAAYGSIRTDGTPLAPGEYSDSVVVTVNF